jgi:hypothetical protein
MKKQIRKAQKIRARKLKVARKLRTKRDNKRQAEKVKRLATA